MVPRAVVFDITGTLRWANGQAIAGAAEAVEMVRSAGLVVRCFSNTPRQSPAQVAASLQASGFSIEAGEILAAGHLAVEYVAQKFPGRRVFVLERSVSLAEDLQRRGLTPDRTESAEVVLVALGALGKPLAEGELERAAVAIQKGAAFLAASLDLQVPYEEGMFLPTDGTFIQVMAQLSGRRPTVIGKPSTWAARRLLRHLGMPGDDILMVGDHPRSDIVFGHRMGAQTALVLTGVALPWEARTIAQSRRPPNVVLASVRELPVWLDTLT